MLKTDEIQYKRLKIIRVICKPLDYFICDEMKLYNLTELYSQNRISKCVNLEKITTDNTICTNSNIGFVSFVTQMDFFDDIDSLKKTTQNLSRRHMP